MGNWVTVEALRQIKISAKLPPISKLGAVVLAAPDMISMCSSRDAPVRQTKAAIIVSRDDKALRFLILSPEGNSDSEPIATMRNLRRSRGGHRYD